MKLRLPILICLVLLMGRNSIAQIVLNQTTVNDYVTRICGPGITFSNATLTGDNRAIANFVGGISGGLGSTMNSGIVMSTGFVNAANTLQGARTIQRSDDNNGPSIAALNTIAGAGTNDGIILEFDFIPITNQINVNFQFGSEEYNEYVNGGYNDAFAFFISGPGIVGTPNIAVVPGVGTPVTIDNINRGYAVNCGGGCTNCAYYNDNCNSTFNNCMDGFTTMLTASQAVIPCSTYHIRLMIADGGDSIYDSWVFVQENGLFAVGNPPVALNASSGGGVGVFPEACSNALVTFSIPTAQPADYTFNVTYTGTATYGVDYSSLPTSITIPAGATTVSIPVVIYADGITEGSETIIITYPATICEMGMSTITIVDADPLTVTASNDTYICASGGSVPISASAAGGTGTVTYTWNNGAGTGTPVTVAPGSTTTYTVTATDQCANVATDQVVVNVTNLTGLTATPSNCTTGNQYSISGQIAFTAAPPTGTLTVTSSCGGTQIFNAPFTSPLSYNLTGLIANGATCTVTAAFSAVPCSITQNYTAPALPAIVASNDVAFCIGGSTPISATGGSTYSWNNGLGAGASHTVSPTATTTYTVTGTGANNCTNTDQVVVTVNPLPTIVASNDVAICIGGSTPISATGGSTYSWNNGLGAGASHTVSPTTTTTYTVTGTDANGCVNTDQVIVTVNPLPTIVASNDVAICIGGSTPISATGGSTYSWNNGLGSGASHTVSPTATTTYTVTGTDANGCVNTDQVIVTVNPLPTIVASNDVAICIGVSTPISATGGSTYSWNNGLGSGASHTVSPPATTTYAVTGTDANGCVNTDQVIVTVNPLPAIVASNDVAICIGGSTPISATGGSTYSWNNGLGSGASHTVSPTTTTTYTVTGTDANGCVNTDQVIVTVNPLPTIVASNDVAICIGGSTPVFATGGSTYSWNNGLGSGASHTVSPTATTTYTVTGTDANGCVNTDQVIVTVNPLPAIVASNDVAICIGGSTPVSATGGSTYSWNNGLGSGASHTVSPTATTTYMVTGTDANGCVNTDQVIVTVNPLPTAMIAGTTTVCQG
ncbi:hypothetical protein G5B10_05175, partial [Fluviicola sp. SGL-29]|nr:hypothetical protein [Fluviicola sp. SGL-29]